MIDKHISDHCLQLYLDRQLDPKTHARIRRQINSSTELQARVQKIKQVKEMVALAYLQEQPAKPSRDSSFLQTPLLSPALSMLVVVVSLALGWYSNMFYREQALLAQAPQSGTQIVDNGQLAQLHGRKFMLHLEAMDNHHFDQAITEAATILHSYSGNGIPVRVALLFDQESVRIFQPEYAFQFASLQQLVKDNDNIELFACSDSIRHFLQQKELPAKSGLFDTHQVIQDMIPRRIDEGWVYIKT